MRERLKYALGWLCFQAVMVLSVRMDSPVYCWLLGWAGYYAHDPRHTSGVPGAGKTVDGGM